MTARWMRTASDRLPRFYHTTAPCFAQLAEFEESNQGTARGLGMSFCPDCEREERRNALAQTVEPPLRAGG